MSSDNSYVLLWPEWTTSFVVKSNMAINAYGEAVKASIEVLRAYCYFLAVEIVDSHCSLEQFQVPLLIDGTDYLIPCHLYVSMSDLTV